MRVALLSLVLLLAVLSLDQVGRAPVASAAAVGNAQPAASPGADVFHQRWVVAPSAFGAWGRGPTSNGEACTDCHVNGGRGHPPQFPDEPLRAGLLRLSIPGRDARGAPLPDPTYGDQVQFEGVLGKVPGEAEVHVRWHTHTIAFADGETVTLRRPVVELRELRFGPIGVDTMRSLRIAPPLTAVGVIAAISEQAILNRAQAQAALGLDGRPNRVWDQHAQRPALGRLGWKATQPTLRQQIAIAFRNDLGVTSALYPEENCPAPQVACGAYPRPSRPELGTEQLEALAAYLGAGRQGSRVETADPAIRRGEHLFDTAGCGACHALDPAMTQTTRAPLTDVLLHDMGEGLSDGRPDFAAGPRDWRTAPLIGLGRDRGPFLHDGRARTLAEAVLWHGGEAYPARERFRNMPSADRAALLAYLSSL